ncbi:MAG: 50S ribosomal protein L17 [Eggerthellaceae bacterium]|nr:50S ribosomal protein L17 [Eggerthellaceae bacterium]
MRHNYKGRKLGTSPSHTKAMKRSLTAALLYNDRIKTIESRAKEIRPEVDRIITWAKKGDVHSRRLAIARLGGGEDNKEIVREIFEKVEQGMFADRDGGYTRIMKLGPRKGDGAPMVIMELCTEPVKKKAKKTAEPKKAAKKIEEPEVVEEETEEIIDVEAEAVEEVEDAAEVVEEAAEEVAEEAAEVAEEATEEAAE